MNVFETLSKGVSSAAICACIATLPGNLHAQTEEAYRLEFDASWYLSAINAEAAYKRGYDGRGILVAVVDSGLDIHHPEFFGRISPLSYSFLDIDPLNVFDPDGHGTHVAGIIGAARNGIGNMGVAYGAELMALKAIGDAEPGSEKGPFVSPDNNALFYAASNGAKVINGSYGPPAFPSPDLDDENENPNYRVMPRPIVQSMEGTDYREDAVAVSAAANADVVLVFAAGNEFEEQPDQAANPTGIGFLPLITAENLRAGVFDILIDATDIDDPDTYDYADPLDPEFDDLDLSDLAGSLIAVVATGRDGTIAGYSNRCGLAWQWCLAAPGGDSPKPGQTIEYSAIISTLPGGNYGPKAGTSMASPVVAGGAAVLRQAFPYMTARQIIELILTTARPIGPQEIYGRGMFDLGRAVLGPKYFGDPLFGPTFDVNTRGYNSVWEGDISGPGGLIKRGAGNLILLGVNTYSGGTRVFGGELTLLGSLGSDVEVLTGATLRGDRSMIAGDLTTSGTLAPGIADGYVGEMLVNGDVSLSAASTYRIDVAGDLADQLNVMDMPQLREDPDTQKGSVTLESGTIDIRLKDGLAPLVPLDIITAQNGVSGTFGSITTNSISPFLDPYLFYGDAVTLSFVPNGTTLASAATSPNQSAVANALDHAPCATAWKHVSRQSLDGARKAFDQLSGEIYATQKTAIVEGSRNVRDAANDRLRSATGGAGALSLPILAYGPDGTEASPSNSERFTVWSAAYGGWGHLDADGNAAALESGSGGFLMGGDLPVGDGWRVGMLTGMGWGDYSVDDRSSTTDMKGYHLGLYGGGVLNALGLRAGLAYSWLNLETWRKIDFPGLKEQLNAEYHGGLFQAFGEVSWKVDKEEFKFEPFVNLAHVTLRTGAFSEGGTVGLSSQRETFNTTSATTGLRASMELEKLPVPAKLNASVGWRHALGGKSPTSELKLDGVPSFTTTGLPRVRNEAVLGVRLDLGVAERATMSVSYNGSFSADARTNTFDARLKIRF